MINQMIWRMIFHAFTKISDNTGIILLLVTIFVAVLLSIPSFYYKNALVRSFFGNGYPGIIDYGFFLSVYFLLRNLPVIHPRIHTALSTTSYIILHSATYKKVLSDYGNIKIEHSSDIVYYLYRLSPEELLRTRYLNPTMLYEKVCNTLHETRYAFGGFIDTGFSSKTSYLFLLLAAGLILLSVLTAEESDITRCILSNIVLFLFFKKTEEFMRGLVVVVSVYVFLKIIVLRLLRSLIHGLKQKDDRGRQLFIHIRGGKNYRKEKEECKKKKNSE